VVSWFRTSEARAGGRGWFLLGPAFPSPPSPMFDPGNGRCQRQCRRRSTGPSCWSGLIIVGQQPWPGWCSSCRPSSVWSTGARCPRPSPTVPRARDPFFLSHFGCRAELVAMATDLAEGVVGWAADRAPNLPLRPAAVGRGPWITGAVSLVLLAIQKPGRASGVFRAG